MGECRRFKSGKGKSKSREGAKILKSGNTHSRCEYPPQPQTAGMEETPRITWAGAFNPGFTLPREPLKKQGQDSTLLTLLTWTIRVETTDPVQTPIE